MSVHTLPYYVFSPVREKLRGRLWGGGCAVEQRSQCDKAGIMGLGYMCKQDDC